MRKVAAAEKTIPRTMVLVYHGSPGPAILKNSSKYVRPRNVPADIRKPNRAQDGGKFRPRPSVFCVLRHNVRLWSHSPKPPNGHIAHQARPMPTMRTKMRQNQRNHVMAVAKFSPASATPNKPMKITAQKMIWFGKIMKNWSHRCRTRRAIAGWEVNSKRGEGSEAEKRSLTPFRWTGRKRMASESGSPAGVGGSCSTAIS